MKDTFSYFLELPENNFNDYLKYSLNKDTYFNTFLLQAGVIGLADIVKAINETFSKYSKDYIPLLQTILTEDDVKKEVKLQVITIIGEICYKIRKEFIPFLEGILQILFGACGLALTSNSEDSEMEDYIQNLIYSLVETFTLIFFGLDDCGENKLFTQFVPHIFDFFKNLVLNESNYSVLKIDNKFSILGFYNDMINAYGKEINQILNKDVVEVLIRDLKNSNMNKYVKMGIEAEDVSRLVYFFTYKNIFTIFFFIF